MTLTLISARKGYEMWAKFDQSAQVYEIFFDQECESYTGWAVDSLKDAKKAVEYIIAEHTAE
jgi:hypothetical protein